MITNFEEITEDLTEKELEYLQDIQEGIAKALLYSGMPKKQDELIFLINNSLFERYGMACCMILKPVRLRKYINYIRKNSLMPIMATSNGYFLSENEEMIRSQIKSLNERAKSIRDAAKGLENYLNVKQLKTA